MIRSGHDMISKNLYIERFLLKIHFRNIHRVNVIRIINENKVLRNIKSLYSPIELVDESLVQ